MPTFNTMIGAAYVVAIPAYLMITIFSFHQWSETTLSRFNWRIWLRSYRLAVTALCLTTTVFVVDITRLRYHITIWMIPPNPNSYGVLVGRWIWVMTIYWAFYAMYRHYASGLFRWVKRRGRPQPKPAPPVDIDPHIDEDVRKIVEIRRDTRQMTSLVERLRSIADELNERIERDQAIALGNENPKHESRRRTC